MLSTAAVLILIASGYVLADELCISDNFNVSCKDEKEIIFFESVIYGRSGSSRCYNLTDNETECWVDIRLQLQRHFGYRRNISFGLAQEIITSHLPDCAKKPPSLLISHQCTKVTNHEICVSESLLLECQDSFSLLIQKALYGRLHSSRCINWDKENLNCYADVQSYLESKCNGRRNCYISGADEKLREAQSTCAAQLQPYLHLSYTCIHGFSCPQFTIPTGATLERISNGYNIACPNSTKTSAVCVSGNWKPDINEICSRKADDSEKVITTIMFVVPSVILVISIAAVAILLRQIKTKSKNRSNTEESDYPESHLRRQQQVTTCQYEYEAYDEYEFYGDYSEVRNTGP